MKITALLTGRGNNTLRDKNIFPIFGKPLLYYAATAGKGSKLVNDWYVSSEDQNILAAAGGLGYKPIVRPAELSRPESQHIDAIRHGLKVLQDANQMPDVLVVLLANNPAVKAEWIDDCISIILDKPEVSSVVPVYREMDHHPYRAKRLDADGYLQTYFDFTNQRISTNRQDLPPNYFLCHNFWVLNVQLSVFAQDGQQPWTFLGKRIRPYVIERTVDLHKEQDVVEIEAWLRENNLVPR
jgi:CMP-N,N'-diacetyllegionaminic acid synthase